CRIDWILGYKGVFGVDSSTTANVGVGKSNDSLVKFHDVPLVAYTSDGLSLIATKIGTPMMLDTYTNSMCLESWERSSYERVLIEINVFGYTKETTHALKRVENRMDKGRVSRDDSGGGADDEGFIEVKRMPPPAGTNKASTSEYNEESPSNKGNGSFSISNSFEALNVDNPIIEEVATGSKILEGKLALVDDDGKPPEKVDYPDNLDNDDEGFYRSNFLYGLDLLFFCIERGFLSSGVRGVKQKKGNAVNSGNGAHQISQDQNVNVTLLNEWRIKWIKARVSRDSGGGADDEGSIEVKRKKSGGNNGGNKHFKSVSVKLKTQYRPKAKQSTAGTPPPAGTNKASTSGYNEKSPRNKVRLLPLGKLALVDDDGKPPEKVDYSDNLDNDDEVEHVQNETASFLALKGVRYDRKACGNNGGIHQ
nr:hypothetical protein [Tanacetum cinerariifolium]